jgi:hypothetical protein
LRRRNKIARDEARKPTSDWGGSPQPYLQGTCRPRAPPRRTSIPNCIINPSSYYPKNSSSIGKDSAALEEEEGLQW